MGQKSENPQYLEIASDDPQFSPCRPLEGPTFYLRAKYKEKNSGKMWQSDQRKSRFWGAGPQTKSASHRFAWGIPSPRRDLSYGEKISAISWKMAEISRSKEIPVAPSSGRRWTASHRFVADSGRGPWGLRAPEVRRPSAFKRPRNVHAKFRLKSIWNRLTFSRDSKKTKSESID